MRRSPSCISDALATKHSGMGALLALTLAWPRREGWRKTPGLKQGRAEETSDMPKRSRNDSAPGTPRSIAGGADRAPNALRRRRHVHVLDAHPGERVQHSVHEHRRARRDAGLAAALDAQRIALGRILRQLDVEVRKVIRARHAVVEKACGQKLPRA